MPTVAQMYGSTIVMYMFVKWFDKKKEPKWFAEKIYAHSCWDLLKEEKKSRANLAMLFYLFVLRVLCIKW